MNPNLKSTPDNYPRPFSEIVAEMRSTPDSDYKKDEDLEAERRSRILLEGNPANLADCNRRKGIPSASAES